MAAKQILLSELLAKAGHVEFYNVDLDYNSVVSNTGMFNDDQRLNDRLDIRFDNKTKQIELNMNNTEALYLDDKLVVYDLVSGRVPVTSEQGEEYTLLVMATTPIVI